MSPPDEKDIVSACILAVQGIESDLLQRQSFEVLHLVDFGREAIYEEIDEDEDEGMILEQRNSQEYEKQLMHDHRQLVNKTQSGFRVTEDFRYGISAISLSQVEIAEKISALGNLYDEIQFYCKNGFNHTKCQISQCLLSTIHQKVLHFYQFLSENNVSTLRGLYVYCLPIIREFQVIVLVLQQIQKQKAKGGQIISLIHKLCNHGNPTVHNLIQYLFTAIVKKWLEMLQRWLSTGYLTDGNQEFFILDNQKEHIDFFWSKKYSLTPAMLPDFLPEPLATKILYLGKSVAFLLKCCNSTYSGAVFSFSAPVFPIYSLVDAITLFVQEKQIDIDREIIHTLTHKFEIVDHLMTMKRFLFFQRGDFSIALFYELEQELGKMVNRFSKGHIQDHVNAACSASLAKLDDPAKLRRLHVNMTSETGIGWDVFSLSYAVDQPISTIFQPSTLENYQKLSKFCWKIIRVHTSLVSVQRNLLLRFFKVPEVHKFQLIQSDMQRFVYELQFYFQHVVIEQAWAKFMTKFSAATNLDTIIHHHQEYLDTIVQQMLLDDSHSDIFNILDSILNFILVFQTLSSALYTNVKAYKQRMISQLEPSLDKLDMAKYPEYAKISHFTQQYCKFTALFVKSLREKEFPFFNYKFNKNLVK